MDEFARLIGVTADPTNPEMNSAMSALIEMSQRNRIQFLGFCAQFLQAPMLPPQQYLMCLSAAKETTKIRCRPQRKEIRDVYDENREVVEALKLSILPFLASENDPLRNMAAVTAATIFEIEMQKWSSLLDILVEILGSTTHSPCHKVGAITVFHEILGLVTFSDIPPQLVEFLRLLTVFLTSNDVPLYFLKLSGDCLLEIIKKFPKILDDQVRIEAVWSIYPVVLPKSDYELYVTLHRVLIRILKSFYEKIDCYMSVVFDIVLNGITNAPVNCKVVSLRVFSKLCKYENPGENGKGVDPEKNKKLSEPLVDSVLASVINILVSIPDEHVEVFDATDIESEVVDVIVVFSKAYPALVVEKISEFIRQNILSDNWKAVHTCLYFLYGMCKSKRDECMELQRLAFQALMTIVTSHPLPRIVWQGLIVLRKIVKNIHRLKIDFMFDDLLGACLELMKRDNPAIVTAAAEVIEDGLLLGLPERFAADPFGSIMEICVTSLKAPSHDNDDIIKANMKLVRRLAAVECQNPDVTPVRMIVDQFMFPMMEENLDVFGQNQSHADQKLIELMNLLWYLIRNWHHNLTSEDDSRILEILHRCRSYHHAILYEDVLRIFTEIVYKKRHLAEEFILRDSGVLISDALISHSPDVTLQGLMLYRDMIKALECLQVPALGEMNTRLINAIGDLIPFQDEPGFQPVIPALVETLATVVPKCDPRPPGSFEHLMTLADKLADMPCDPTDEESLKQAKLNFRAYFQAYDFFYREDFPHDFAMAKKKVTSMCRKCVELKAYDDKVAFVLRKFLEALLWRFGTRIALSCNSIHIHQILNAGAESKDKYIRDKCRESLVMIRTYKDKPREGKLEPSSD